ncbi:MAG: hypothetical protein HGA96_09620 [Desulfobulbaceae bacterium]|nr:hypothetical protein [Desulfobulbaceae bacterium]
MTSFTEQVGQPMGGEVGTLFISPLTANGTTRDSKQINNVPGSSSIGFQGGDLNLMGYTGGSPVMGIDPFGLKVTIKINRDTLYWGGSKTISGSISVSSDSECVEDKFYGFTLEPYWGGTNRDKLPVANGIYSAFVRKDHTPRRIELSGVSKYNNIQIHSGNTIEDTHGCFLVGTNRSFGKVSNSTAAM